MNCEKLNFKKNYFDLIYSWGVLHHTNNIEKSINEIYEKLKKNGEIKIMLYNKYSLVGFMLYVYYSIIKLNFYSLNTIYDRFLESPGTQAFTIKEIKILLKKFRDLEIKNVLTHADLLDSQVGQRHNKFIISLAKFFWPRFLIKIFLKKFGFFLLIKAKK